MTHYQPVFLNAPRKAFHVPCCLTLSSIYGFMDGEVKWFTKDNSFIQDGQRYAGVVVVLKHQDHMGRAILYRNVSPES